MIIVSSQAPCSNSVMQRLSKNAEQCIVWQMHAMSEERRELAPTAGDADTGQMSPPTLSTVFFVSHLLSPSSYYPDQSQPLKAALSMSILKMVETTKLRPPIKEGEKEQDRVASLT